MDEIKIELQKLTERIDQVVRRQDEIQKAVDLLFTDRAILEDMQANITGLKEIIVLNQQHQDTARQNLRADIKDVQIRLEDKVDKVQDSVNNTEVILIKQNIFDKIKRIVGRK